MKKLRLPDGIIYFDVIHNMSKVHEKAIVIQYCTMFNNCTYSQPSSYSSIFRNKKERDEYFTKLETQVDQLNGYLKTNDHFMN